MLAVVIVSYKNNQLTIDFVNNEVSKIAEAHKTVIVNNGASWQDSLKLAKALKAILVMDKDKMPEESDCYVIHNSDNSGFSIGNNIGADFSIRYFPVDYLLFSNNDIRLLSSNVIENLLSKINEDASIGIIGPEIVGLDGKRQSPEPYMSFSSNYIFKPLLSRFSKREWYRNLFKMDYSQMAEEGFYYKLMGSFFLMKSMTYIKISGFDEATFLYYEENILSERLKNINLYPYFYPKVKVLHNHSVTISKYNSEKRMWCYNLDSAIYYYNHYRGNSLLFLRIGRLFFFFLLKTDEIKKIMKNKLKKALMMFT